MKTILALWEGRLEPGRRCGIGREMREVEELLERNRNKLKATLNENEQSILDKYDDCIEEQLFIVAEQAFYEGYCLGTQLTAEALTSTMA